MGGLCFFSVLSSPGRARDRARGLPLVLSGVSRQTSLYHGHVEMVCHRNLCVGGRRDHHGPGPIHGRLSGWSSGPLVLSRGSRDSTSMSLPRIQVVNPGSCNGGISTVSSLLSLLFLLFLHVHLHVRAFRRAVKASLAFVQKSSS